MDFEIVSEVVNVETIAINLSIRERIDLRPATAADVGGSGKAKR
jgi:hypothetical protein